MIKDVLAIPQLGARGADGSSKFVADLNSPANPDGNNREPSPVRDRTILYYDAKASNCAPVPVKKVKFIICFYIYNFVIFLACSWSWTL